MSEVRLTSGLLAALDKSLDAFGGVLRCETCRTIVVMEPGDAGSYSSKGWPLCCNQTMRWWTQRQIDAGEMS